jgi:hypothetical protein
LLAGSLVQPGTFILIFLIRSAVGISESTEANLLIVVRMHFGNHAIHRAFGKYALSHGDVVCKATAEPLELIVDELSVVTVGEKLLGPQD